MLSVEMMAAGGAMLERQVASGLPRAYLSAVHEKGGWQAFQRSLDAAAEGEGDQWVGEAVQGAEAAFALFAAAAMSEQAMARG